MKINLTLVRKTSQQPLISPFCPHIQIWFTWQTWLNFFDTFVHFLDTYSNSIIANSLGWSIFDFEFKKMQKCWKETYFIIANAAESLCCQNKETSNVKNLVFVSCAKKILMYNGRNGRNKILMYNGVAVRRFTWFDGNNIRDWIFDTAGTKLCFTGHPPKTKTGNASKYKKYSANGTVVDSMQNMTAKHVETSLFTKPRCCKNLIVLSVKWYVWECDHTVGKWWWWPELMSGFCKKPG